MTKINDIRKSKTENPRFDDVCYGNFFLHDNELYIKTDEERATNVKTGIEWEPDVDTAATVVEVEINIVR
jgi:hypothetical protein